MLSREISLRFGNTLFLVCLACLLIGCGGPGDVKLVTATGRVTIDGKPAADIMVRSVPLTQDETKLAPSSQGLSGEGGEFTLTTLKNEPGAIEGPHRVTLIDTLETRGAQGSRGGTRSRLHPKFSSDGIDVTVTEGETIELEATGPK